MKQRILKYRFHNPNTEAETADYILKIMIEANVRKVDQVIQTMTDEIGDDEK